MSIAIREIDQEGLGAFIDFPFDLFKGHPHWVGELKRDTRHMLELSHPFWRHAERRLFMAYRGGQPAGRIAAIVNRAHNSFHGENCGFFGFFDCEDRQETADALFAAAAKYLKAQGMDSVRGPVNPSTNESCGMLLEGFDSDPMVMMPYNPPYYLDLTAGAGFAKAKDLFAFRVKPSHGFGERFEKIVARMNRHGAIKLELVDIKNLDKAIAEIKEIYNSAWDKNWGFVPMTDEEFNDLAAAMRPLLKPEYLYFARVEGQAAGFVMLLPNFNIPLKAVRGSLNPLNIVQFLWKMRFGMRSGRLLTLGVKKEFRNRGIEMLLIKQAFEAGSKMRWDFGEMSWTLEDNEQINRIIETIGGEVYKKYRLFEKKL